MRVAPIVFCTFSFMLGSASIFFVYHDERPTVISPPSSILGVSTASAASPPQRVRYIPSDDEGSYISCAIDNGALGECDDSAMGELVVNVPEYSDPSTPLKVFRLAQGVLPDAILRKITQVRVYGESKKSTAAYVEQQDDGKWTLGIVLDPHLYKHGGIDDSSIKVTLLHEWGHILARENTVLFDGFVKLRARANEGEVLVSNTMGANAARSPDEDFAESYAMFLALNTTKNNSQQWRMDFFSEMLPGARKDWREKWNSDELSDMNNVWLLALKHNRFGTY